MVSKVPPRPFTVWPAHHWRHDPLEQPFRLHPDPISQLIVHEDYRAHPFFPHDRTDGTKGVAIFPVKLRTLISHFDHVERLSHYQSRGTGDNACGKVDTRRGGLVG